MTQIPVVPGLPSELRECISAVHPIRDVHATLLSLLGLDDENLTYHYAGRIRRLTDIRGNVLKTIIA